VLGEASEQHPAVFPADPYLSRANKEQSSNTFRAIPVPVDLLITNQLLRSVGETPPVMS
jgi:hypothetical protein